MSERQRYASTALTAPLVWHYLDAPDGRWALCGESRRGWAPVEHFAVPGAFAPCRRCLFLDRNPDE